VKLSDSQLQEFKENGFLLLRGFLEPKECEIIREIAKVHLKYKIEPIETEYEYIGIDKEEYKSSVRRLRQVYDRDIVFKNWMTNQKIRPILQQVIGEDVILLRAHHNSIMTKLAGTSTHTCWHRDSRYWHFDGTNLVSIWLALGEENSQNGVLEFIPKSHKMDLGEECFDDKSFFREDWEINKDLASKKVSYNLSVGDVVLFHSELLHRANENKSNNDKISFVYTVRGKSTKPIKGTRSSAYQEINL